MSEETPLILGDVLAAELDRPPRRRRWFRGKKKPPPPLTHCENCGTALAGPFCAQCGQPAVDYRRSLGSLMVDAADAFFNFDARFFQSFGLLLVKPWRLTNEFIEGKRARHVHPLRVYLIASVTFFLVINFLSRENHPRADASPTKLYDSKVKGEPSAAPAVPLAAAVNLPEDDPASFFSVDLDTAPAPPPGISFSRSRPMGLSVSPAASPNRKVFFEELDQQKNVPPFLRWVEARVKEKIGPTGDRGDLFLKALIQNIAPMVLCCIPLFAVVLKILYIFKRRYYIDHLIFALHTHAFVFLSTVIIIGIGFLLALKSRAATAVICTLLGVTVVIQLLIAIRRVYGQNWFTTFFKFVLGSVIYMILLSLAFGVTAFLTLLLP